MTRQKFFFLLILLAYAFQSLSAASLLEQFKQHGYVELCDTNHGRATFDLLYAYFDGFIDFLQKNPPWAQKLYIAKERFIRTKGRGYYSTDFFGLYDESQRAERGQIAFYYSAHFHDFLCSHYKEFNTVAPISRFFEICHEIQKSYSNVFNEAADLLGLGHIFKSHYDQPPILFKLIKYLPSYRAKKPHYDGTAFSLFLDSTDNQSLLMSPYKTSFMVDCFASPLRKFSRSYNQNSMILIPGAFLTEFSINPTPHIVMQNGAIRYAAIAFAMRPYYNPEKRQFASLPDFSH